jgi:hypothetical protein
MLYKRSLYLIGPAHPWLAGMHEGKQASVDLAALRSAFAQQSSANAAARRCLPAHVPRLAVQPGRAFAHRAIASSRMGPLFKRPARPGHLAMTTKVTINRLATGVPGLDEVLGGGLPEFSFNLIAGPPGCGKTTLAHQMMFALATPERPALYFTVLGRAAPEDAALPAAVRLLRQRTDQPLDTFRQLV